MKARYAPFYGLLLVLLTACATLGIAPAKSTDQQLAYAAGQVTGLRSAAASALAAKTITVEDAEKVLKMTDDAKALIDGARAALATGDEPLAQNRLLLATNVLTALRAFLERKPS